MINIMDRTGIKYSKLPSEPPQTESAFDYGASFDHNSANFKSIYSYSTEFIEEKEEGKFLYRPREVNVCIIDFISITYCFGYTMHDWQWIFSRRTALCLLSPFSRRFSLT